MKEELYYALLGTLGVGFTSLLSFQPLFSLGLEGPLEVAKWVSLGSSAVSILLIILMVFIP